MKSYFGKQVIERPRSGSSRPSLKARYIGRFDEEGEYDGPLRIPSSMHGVEKYSKIQSKNFTDLLGPVERYLHSKVGCRWDDVFSELARELGSGSYPIRHVLNSHILSRHKDSGPLDFYGHRFQFSVDENGIVCKRENRRTFYGYRDENAGRKVSIGNGRFFVESGGLWYIGKFVLSTFSHPRYGSAVNWPDYADGYGSGAKVFRFEKEKQASKKELKDLRIRLSGVAGAHDGLKSHG